jgi:hypothetical protein
MGVLLALVLVMQTDRGREILKERFTVGFDQRRKEKLLGLAVKESDVDARSTDEANEDVGRTTQKMLICTPFPPKFS